MTEEKRSLRLPAPQKGVVAFGFGVPWSIRSNLDIALIAMQKAVELKARVYTQRDVRIDAGYQAADGFRVDYYDEEDPKNPPTTLGMARAAARWAAERNMRELWIVAAKPHLWRCVRDLRAAITEIDEDIGVRVCKEIEQFPEDHSWFCPDSTQVRTQNRLRWYRREVILKVMPFFIYKRVAG